MNRFDTAQKNVGYTCLLFFYSTLTWAHHLATCRLKNIALYAWTRLTLLVIQVWYHIVFRMVNFVGLYYARFFFGLGDRPFAGLWTFVPHSSKSTMCYLFYHE